MHQPVFYRICTRVVFAEGHMGNYPPPFSVHSHPEQKVQPSRTRSHVLLNNLNLNWNVNPQTNRGLFKSQVTTDINQHSQVEIYAKKQQKTADSMIKHPRYRMHHPIKACCQPQISLLPHNVTTAPPPREIKRVKLRRIDWSIDLDWLPHLCKKKRTYL